MVIQYRGRERSLSTFYHNYPVEVSKRYQTIKTFASLDTGSSATFCTENLMQRLNLSGRRIQFLLQTMGQENVVPAFVLSGLDVFAIDDNIFYQLPQMLTQKQMPVSPDNIVSKSLTWPMSSSPCNG